MRFFLGPISDTFFESRESESKVSAGIFSEQIDFFRLVDPHLVWDLGQKFITCPGGGSVYIYERTDEGSSNAA